MFSLLLAVALAQDPVQSFLQTLHGDPFRCDEERATIAGRLGAQAEFLPAILREIGSNPRSGPDDFYVANLHHALGHAGTPEAMASLMKLAKSSEWTARMESFGVLGHYDAPEVRKELLGLLGRTKDEEFLVLGAGIRSLARLKEPAAVKPLLQFIREDHELLAYFAAMALGDLGDPSAATELVALCTPERRDSTRAAVAVAAARLGRSEFEPHLLALLTSKDEGLCQLASDYFLSKGDLAGAAYYLTKLTGGDREAAAVHYRWLRQHIPDLPVVHLAREVPPGLPPELAARAALLVLPLEEGRRIAEWFGRQRANLVFDTSVRRWKLASTPEAPPAGAAAHASIPLAGRRRTEGKLGLTPLDLKLERNSRVSDLEWSGDGTRVVLLETTGVLRKVSVPELVEEKTFRFGKKCWQMTRCKEGLLLVLREVPGEVWLVGEQDLDVKWRLPAGDLRRLVSAPDLSVAYGAGGPDVTIFDTKEGKIKAVVPNRDLAAQAAKARKHKDSAPFAVLETPALSPDGKYLFGSSMGCVVRIRVDGAKLTVEETGPRLGSTAVFVAVSPDGSRLATGTGAIYKASSLQKPETELKDRFVAWDPASGKILASPLSPPTNLFRVVDVSGRIQAEHALPQGMDLPLELTWVRPVDPTSLFCLTRLDTSSQQVVWVELPK